MLFDLGIFTDHPEGFEFVARLGFRWIGILDLHRFIHWFCNRKLLDSSLLLRLCKIIILFICIYFLVLGLDTFFIVNCFVFLLITVLIAIPVANFWLHNIFQTLVFNYIWILFRNLFRFNKRGAQQLDTWNLWKNLLWIFTLFL